ncbi:MAG: DUF2927 domain-containing protein, partial [Thermoleophilia bacterium]|nr:DUF2927 domain-containing protein [Thermoleophilia bacterium]
MTGLGTALPPARTFGPPPARPVAGSEAGLAADFLDLAFRMESGRPVPALSRFEGPVRLRTAGTVPPLAEADLARLIGRLRSEAGIDIARAADGAADGVADGRANLTVEFIPRRTISALVPQAACFVAPNVGSWAEYRRARRTGRTDWTGLRVRERIAVFIPGDVAPQEVRDCLNEEIAQGLGPLNDLYRLPESVLRRQCSGCPDRLRHAHAAGLLRARDFQRHDRGPGRGRRAFGAGPARLRAGRRRRSRPARDAEGLCLRHRDGARAARLGRVAAGCGDARRCDRGRAWLARFAGGICLVRARAPVDVRAPRHGARCVP